MMDENDASQRQSSAAFSGERVEYPHPADRARERPQFAVPMISAVPVSMPIQAIRVVLEDNQLAPDGGNNEVESSAHDTPSRPIKLNRVEPRTKALFRV